MGARAMLGVKAGEFRFPNQEVVRPQISPMALMRTVRCGRIFRREKTVEGVSDSGAGVRRGSGGHVTAGEIMA